jgi:hypothetical protein
VGAGEAVEAGRVAVEEPVAAGVDLTPIDENIDLDE